MISQPYAARLSIAILLIAGVAFSSKGQEPVEPPAWPILESAGDPAPFPGTKPLKLEGDLSRKLVEGADRFLDSRIDAWLELRSKNWKRDFSSPEAYGKSVEPNRQRFAERLGLHRDARPEKNRFEFTGIAPGPIAEGDGVAIHPVRWKIFGGVHGVGLLLRPEGIPRADVVAIPDADQAPEILAGLAEGDSGSGYALRLARTGCQVLVPLLINREENQWKLTHREWLHRPAFELGRHLLGYELHKILAGIDCLEATQGETSRPVGVIGWGEGGLLSFYASAIDPRIESTCVSGYFGPRQQLWNEPAEHNVFGLLREFGDAEIASLIAPRPLVIEHGHYPEFVYRPGEDGEPMRIDTSAKKPGKPGKFIAHSADAVRSEADRLLRLVTLSTFRFKIIESESALSDETLGSFLEGLRLAEIKLAAAGSQDLRRHSDPDAAYFEQRNAEQVAEIDRHNQWALVESRRDRTEFFAELKTDTFDEFKESIEPYREIFREEVVGRFDVERVPPNPRTRKYQVGEKTVSYEVVLDVLPNVMAYGILTLPKDLNPETGDRRPVVVCQHGLEGRPQDVIGEEGFRAYKSFATRLAEMGFVTFAPQNLYIFHDQFRIQQFKAQSIGSTLFSVIVPQHQQITDWLASLRIVDPERIAFYGLSYGGKSAMRIPPLVDRYCLSICSADFNEWVWKNSATDPKSSRYSYVNKREYEIFEWDLGGTFNYAEMAALICPRPFMVERGHFDGVAPDETVAYEFAKVRNLYQAKLGFGDRCEIEWFVGPHSINGQGTYAFLRKHLKWPEPQSEPEAKTEKEEK